MVPPSAMNWMCRDLSLKGEMVSKHPKKKSMDLPSSHIAIFFSCFDIAIDSCSLLETASLGLVAGGGVDIVGMSIGVW